MQPPIIVMPEPNLEQVENQTPFPHMAFFKMAPGGHFHDVVVVHGSFDLIEGRVTAAQKQSGPVLADLCWDPENAARSSLKTAGDLLLYKPGTDVYLAGSTGSAQHQPLPRWSAGVMVLRGTTVLLRHFLELTGPRQWQNGLFRGWYLSGPAPTDIVPLRYELAYGGAFPKLAQPDSAGTAIKWETCKTNPSGSGFFDERYLDRNAQFPGPQFEDPATPIRGINKAYPLTGFGPVARFWKARSQYAGTYDTHWRNQYHDAMAKGECPDYPPDFDMRFYQCAPPQLISAEHFHGNERIALGGLLADAPVLWANLPGISLHAHILAAQSPTQPPPIPLKLDTVHLDLDARRLNLSWRLCLPYEADVRSIAITMEAPS